MGATPYERLTPTQIGTNLDWKFVSAGNEFSIGNKTNGTLWALGSNYFGNLGDGTKVDKFTPIQIGTASDWLNVFCEFDKTFALKNE